jgi:uncharacterized membrane protein
MSRLTQLGLLSIVLGSVLFFLGLFPFAVDSDITSGIGAAQLMAMLTGLSMLILGAYVTVYSSLHRGHRRTLIQDVGLRLGMTGLVFSVAATLADLLGFGSHTLVAGPTFGWLQALGMLSGFMIAALGVLIYATAR